MYPLFLASGLGTTILLCCLLIPDEAYYISGPFLGLVAALLTFVVLSRKIGGKVRPIFEQAQRQLQAGNVDQALLSFEKALVYKNWQLFLEKQVNTQVGTIHFAAGDEEKAIERLREGYPKSAEGHMVLGAALYRAGKLEEAKTSLENGIRFNPKARLLYNLLAWILAKEKQNDAAIAVLESGLKPLADDEDTVANLEKLRAGKRMNMKPFGQHWFMLKFETPKGMVQGGQLRKGFRQPPKGKGRARKRK